MDAARAGNLCVIGSRMVADNHAARQAAAPSPRRNPMPPTGCKFRNGL